MNLRLTVRKESCHGPEIYHGWSLENDAYKIGDLSNYVASDPIPLKTLKDLKLGQRIIDLKL